MQADFNTRDEWRAPGREGPAQPALTSLRPGRGPGSATPEGAEKPVRFWGGKPKKDNGKVTTDPPTPS